MPLGGSLRASRAAQLARPYGPLAAVDLADGRALTVARLRGHGWVASRSTAMLRQRAASPAGRPGGRQLRRPSGGGAWARRSALAGALGAAAVALATGFSGSPPPAVAGPTAHRGRRAAARRAAASRAARRGEGALGTRAAARARPPAPPRRPAAGDRHRPAAAAAAAAAAAPPPLPELPPAPAL